MIARAGSPLARLVPTEHVLAVQHLPWFHRDPLDRLLVVQARQEVPLLLTTHRTLSDSGEARHFVKT